MKKLLVVLLSLGLIAAFAAAASADTTNVKFQGAYYIAGVYDNNPSLTDNNGYSRAVFHQRLRLQPVFQIAEGLSFTGRLDALEKNWGDITWKGTGGLVDGDQTSSRKANVNVSEQESIEWERAYVTFKTAIGQFDIGYQNADGWGTQFCDAAVTRARILYTTAMGPLNLGLVYEKWIEGDNMTVIANPAGNHAVDGDMDTYAAFGIYKYKGGEAGLLWKYYYNAAQAGTALAAIAPAPFKQKVHMAAPYFKATIGPVYLEGELNYWFGKATEWTNGTPAGFSGDVDMEALNAYLYGKFNMGPAYFGAQVGYLSGNDPNDNTKVKESPGGKNTTWQPLVIIGGSDRNDWLGGRGIGGGVTGNVLQTVTNKMTNLTLGTIFAGYNPTPKINVEAVVGYAVASKKPGTGAGEFVSDKYGTEFDLKATYKLYDNLSYYVAAGYLWTGDYFKGADAAAKVGNEYAVINKLELAF